MCHTAHHVADDIIIDELREIQTRTHEWGVRNQVELPNGGASKEEALLRIRQLKTGYRYGLYMGISYTFGSIYSNVINRRFGN